MPMFQCMPKTCPGKKACQVPSKVNGKPKLDKCNCEIFKNKPCNNDLVHACNPGQEARERERERQTDRQRDRQIVKQKELRISILQLQLLLPRR